MKRIYLLACAALLCSGAVLLLLCRTPEQADDAAVFPDAYSREYYLNLCGWEVTLLSEREVVIPQEWTAPYEKYAQLQEKQGFALAECKGKAALLCTYAVENYGGSEPVRAELLICEDRLAAGSLYALSGGFQCGLRGESIT